MADTDQSLETVASHVTAQGQDHVTVPIPNRSHIQDLIPNPEIIKEKPVSQF